MRAVSKKAKKDEPRADLPFQIAEQIRLSIVRGALSPGVHLGQTQLAAMAGASRIPVREALKLLAAEGLVSHDPNRGFFVAPLSSDEARQLYRLRILVETEVLSTVRWPNDLQMKSFRKMVDNIERLRASGGGQDWAAKHRAFHLAVFELSPEKVMVREALRLWGLADRYRSLLVAIPNSPSHMEESTDRKLLEALAQKDHEQLLKVFLGVRSGIADCLIATLRARGL